ncbi:hypothetical protein Tco_1202120 [Tanacetum coccineum]
MKMTSATQEEPSEINTFYRLHTVNGVFQDPEALRMYDRMRELRRLVSTPTAEITRMVTQAESFAATFLAGSGISDALARYIQVSQRSGGSPLLDSGGPERMVMIWGVRIVAMTRV